MIRMTRHLHAQRNEERTDREHAIGASAASPQMVRAAGRKRKKGEGDKGAEGREIDRVNLPHPNSEVFTVAVDTFRFGKRDAARAKQQQQTQ